MLAVVYVINEAAVAVPKDDGLQDAGPTQQQTNTNNEKPKEKFCEGQFDKHEVPSNQIRCAGETQRPQAGMLAALQ